MLAPHHHYPMIALPLRNILFLLTTGRCHSFIITSSWAPKKQPPTSSFRRHQASVSLSSSSSSRLLNHNIIRYTTTTTDESSHYTHYIATDKTTITDAIRSTLPHPPTRNDDDVNLIRDDDDDDDDDDDASWGPILIPDDAGKNRTGQLHPWELLTLGSVWYMAADDLERDYVKPTRLSLSDRTKMLSKGDYLRVHHTPRRFSDVHDYDWCRYVNDDDGVDKKTIKKGVILARDDDIGYVIIVKPGKMPVHPTVDNILENVAEAYRRGVYELKRTAGVDVTTWRDNDDDDDKKQKKKIRNHHPIYVAVNHRLDIETSGLFCLSTKPMFSAYFAKLLRRKTSNHLDKSRLLFNDEDGVMMTSEGVKKRYMCLVCICPSDNDDNKSSSMTSELQRLHSLKNTIITHYLQPSFVAPKNYSPSPPPTTDADSPPWLESQLRIVAISTAIPLYSSSTSSHLRRELFGNDIPSGCVAVVPLEIELLTGRTHQIRGQLSALNFSIVGDATYGGGGGGEDEEDGRLALSCCELSFWDPDVVNETTRTKRGREVEETCYRVSERWNCFRYEEAWWTALLQQANDGALPVDNDEDISASTSDDDRRLIETIERTSRMTTDTTMSTIPPHSKRNANDDDELTPPTVQLSPGSNKYVIVRARRRRRQLTTNTDTSDETTAAPQDTNPYRYFVKSATPFECGGPYHSNVAEDLVDHLVATEYFEGVEVMGGGRISYDETMKTVKVFGFSYGFGRGDHEMVARLIEGEMPGLTEVTFSEEEDVY